jgi:hypothetical protein
MNRKEMEVAKMHFGGEWMMLSEVREVPTSIL